MAKARSSFITRIGFVAKYFLSVFNNFLVMRYYNFKTGFSIIEAMTTVFILTLVGMAIWTFQKDIFSMSNIISNNFIVQEEIQKTLKAMSAEIRAALPSSTGAYAIAQIATSSFTFYSDIDNEPLKEQVRYFIDGSILKKGVIKASGVPITYNPANESISDLVRDVVNNAMPVFSYYNTDYDGTTQPLEYPINISEIRLIKITVIVDCNPSQSPNAITLTTQVSMRNLKDNL
ncbi:hypothetical protein KKF17_01050 [Patescibacteria group bacterium]|nr:hypothetical protein [Patescibacteria group bacterium]